MPCIETYQKVDLRTITLGVPPQEVNKVVIGFFLHFDTFLGFNQRQCYSLRRCSGKFSDGKGHNIKYFP